MNTTIQTLFTVRLRTMTLVAAIISVLMSLFVVFSANAAEGYFWRQFDNTPEVQWASVATTPDGSQVVAVQRYTAGNANQPGQMWRSTDGGATWTTLTVPVSNWRTVDISTDGTKIVAAGCSTPLYVSHDSGVTWSANGPTAIWGRVSMSDDGTVVAASQGRVCGSAAPTPWGTNYIHVSTDSGATWTQTSQGGVIALAVSPDGSRIVAGVGTSNTPVVPIYSTNNGSTWTAGTTQVLNSGTGFGDFFFADNQTVFATTGAGSITNGSLHRSTDGGVSFNEMIVSTANSSNSPRVAASGNGQVILTWGGRFSTDGGVTFNQIVAGASEGIGSTAVPILSMTSNGLRTYAAFNTQNNTSAPGNPPFRLRMLSYVRFPGAPANLTATRNGDDVELAWNRPADTGGMASYDIVPMLNYDVEYSDDGGLSWQPVVYDLSTDGTSIVIPGLDPNGTFQFRVTAENLAGQGPAATTTLSPPAPDPVDPPAPVTPPSPEAPDAGVGSSVSIVMTAVGTTLFLISALIVVRTIRQKAQG